MHGDTSRFLRWLLIGDGDRLARARLRFTRKSIGDKISNDRRLQQNGQSQGEDAMKKMLLCAASTLLLACASSSHAQQPSPGNLERLSEFKTTGTPMDIPLIPQTGAKGEAIKRTLAKIKLPRG